MRIALLADIHGNLQALEAVIQDLKTHSPDVVANLGDHLSGPLWAGATADLLMDQKDWVHIRGNHDRQLIEHAPDAMGESDRAACEQLGQRHKAWLSALPPTARIADDVLLCHGTPESDTEYLTEDVSSGFARLAAREDIRSRLGAHTGAILCGHSHVQRFISPDDGSLVANPGSVGLQAYEDPGHRFPHVVETGSPHARYLLLDRTPKGWSATLRLVGYDWETAARLADAGRRPEWARALRTGYAGA